eukprot:10240942-Alexandrium_andersonii.AAC.1
MPLVAAVPGRPPCPARAAPLHCGAGCPCQGQRCRSRGAGPLPVDLPFLSARGQLRLAPAG